MTTPQLTSLLVGLQNAGTLKASDILQDLLGFPEALNKIVQIVETKIDAGTYFSSEPLASLILHTHSETIYNKVRKQLLDNDWVALKLYEGYYPDPEIEKNLCSKLYEIASSDDNPLRSAIVDVMHKVGSEAVLPTLEAILFDLEPSAKIRRMFSDALLNPVEILEARSRTEFVKRVALAIETIKSRISDAAEITVSDTSGGEIFEQVDEVSNSNRASLRAHQYIEGDPEVAVIFIRKGAEALAKDLYRRLGHEKNGKPAKKMMLEDLLKPLKDSDAPEIFKLLVQTFQSFGNFAAHDQDDQSKHLTKEIASALLILYDQALSIYSLWSVTKSVPC